MRVLFTSKLSDYIQGNRISTATDGGVSKQQRCFCTAKTRVQKLTRRSIFERATDGGDITFFTAYFRVPVPKS